MQLERTMQPGEDALQATRSTYAKHWKALETFLRSFKESQVEPGVTKEWRKGTRPCLGAKTMQPDPETQMIQPGKALKALDIFLSSMEEVAAGVAAASSKGPSTRPFRKDDAHKEQRPPLTRSSSEDAGVVWALSHVETEDLSEDWSPVSVAGLTLTQSHSRDSGLDMYTVHDRCATLHHFKVPAKVLLTLPASLPLLYHDSPQYTHLGQQLTLHSLHRDVGDKYLHPQAAPL